MIAPKLRFSEFKDEWKSKKLGEIGEFINGLTYSPSDITDDENKLLVLRSSNIQDSQLAFDDNVFVNLIVEKEKFTQENDILICVRNGSRNLIGKNTIVKSLTYKATHGAFMSVFRSPFNSFIVQLFQTDKYYQYINADLGATINSINGSNIKKYKFYFPSEKEQTKIAEFLSAVDDKISQLSRQLELLNQYKKGVMQKIFSQEIRFKNDNGEDFGEWEEVKFSDIFIEIKDKVGNKNIETYSITAGKGFVSQSEKFGRDISGRQNENYIVLDDNDFSYNKGNSKTYKFGCVYLNNTGQLIAVPNVFISFRAKKNNIAHNFYAKLFEYHYLDKYLRQLISSSARMDGLLNISKEGFFEIPLPFPSKPEQEKIAEFLAAIDERIDHTTAQLTHTKQWKKGLLQQMFV